MHIGITYLSKQPGSNSGSQQTADTLLQMFRLAGHTAEIVDLLHTPPANKLDLLIDIDARQRTTDRSRWARQSVIFLRGTLAFTELDSIVYVEDAYAPRELEGVSEVWCWDELNPADSLPALAALFPCPIRRVPMIWAPTSDSLRAVPHPSTPPMIHVMEKNTSNNSTSVLALVALRELARTHALPPSTQIRVHNMEHLRDNRFLKENVLDNIEWLQLVTSYNAEFVHEHVPFTSWQDQSILLSHTRFSPLRWGLLPILWSGLPVIHNSPVLRDLHPQLRVLYYRGNEIAAETESILAAFKAHRAHPEQWFSVRQEVRDAIRERWGLVARRKEWERVLSAFDTGFLSQPCLSSVSECIVRPLRVAFINMWPGFSPSRNYFTDALRQEMPTRSVEGSMYLAEQAAQPDLLIIGPFGDDWKKTPPQIPRVFFSAENWDVPSDPSIRLFLTPSRREDDVHLRIPTWAIFIDWYSQATTLPTDPEELACNPIRLPLHFATTPHTNTFSQRPDFCGFVVSNPICTMRNDAFHALNAYRQVDSGGALFNNIGGQLSLKYPGGGGGDISKFQFFEQHRFTLSFENAQAPGYVTEKLLHAKMAGCLPLYWGDEEAHSDFAGNSFVNLSKISSADQVVEAVKRLDARPDLCEQIASMPILTLVHVEKALQIQKEMVRRLLALVSAGPVVRIPASTTASACPVVPLQKIDRIYLVNLDRRPDRLQKLLEAEPYWKDNPAFERIAAVDGTTLQLTTFIYELFKQNNYQWKKSAMGCMLSHLRIWSAMVKNPAMEYALILEDDVRFAPNWKAAWNERLAADLPADADLLYLGGVLPRNKPALPLASESVNASWQRVIPNPFFTPDTPMPVFHFCTYSYILHRRGAQKIMDFLAHSPMKAFAACDHFLGHPLLGLKTYHAAELLTTCFQEEDPAYQQSDFNALLRKDTFDSDIWNNTECFTEADREAVVTPIIPVVPVVSAVSSALAIALTLHTLQPMTELYERAWLEDMFQRPILLSTIDECPTDKSIVPWFLVQRPHLAEWNAQFAAYEKEGRPFAVLHLSDEFCADDIDFYKYKACKAVIRNYHREDCPQKPHILTIPLGYHYKAPKEDAQKPIKDRELVWSFHGTDWFQRSEQLRPMTAFVPHSCRLQPGWNHATATKEKQYLSTLTNSKFCPILRGNHRETFRLYEALEAGAVPITTITDLNYLYHMDEEMQFEELYAWNHPLDVLQKPEAITENIRQEIGRRWQNWKKRVQTECTRVIRNAKV